MNAVSAATQPYASIGEVLSQLRPEFPDTTISKLRFLESEGLVDPERTPAGYRKYSDSDIARLRYVLTAQRDHYLPLKVIREHLSDLDSGVVPTPMIPGVTPMVRGHHGEVPQQRAALRAVGPVNVPDEPEVEVDDESAARRFNRVELRELANINEGFLVQLEQFGVVVSDHAGMFNSDDVVIAEAAAGLRAYGVEPRHIRAFRGSVDREIGLYTQIVKPLTHRKSSGNRDQQGGAVDPARQTAAELCALSSRLHSAMLHSAMSRVLPPSE